MHVLVTVEQKHRRCLKQYEHHGTTIPAPEYLPLHLCSVKEKESPPPFSCFTALARIFSEPACLVPRKGKIAVLQHYFLIIALLRYNLHIIKFTLLEYKFSGV